MGGNYQKGLYEQLMEVMAKVDSLESESRKDHREINRLSNEVKRLDRENTSLRDKVTSLTGANTALLQKCAELSEENELLRNDNERMKRILNNDSSNTSIPPSKDGGRPANTYNGRKPSGKKKGAQPGHKGTGLSKADVERNIRNGSFDHKIKTIGDARDGNPYVTRYKLDLDIRTTATEYRIYADKEGKFLIPDDLKGDVVYGDSIKSIIAFLYSEGVVSNDRIAAFVNSISGDLLRVSTGTVYNTCGSFSAKCTEVCDKIEDDLLNSHEICTDGTPVSTDGRQTSTSITGLLGVPCVKGRLNCYELSSDGGLFLLKEFVHRIGFEKVIRDNLQTNDSAAFRFHTDDKNLMQQIFQTLAGYFNDNDADELTTDPVLCAVLGKDALASQPTMSRFFNRMDEDSLIQFEKIFRILRQKIYGIRPPENILLDLDSTLLQTYGHQEGEGFNYHYQSHGYHPLLCFDGLTGDLLKVELRKGTKYCSSDAHLFLESLLNEFLEQYPDTVISLRGDSGFAAPEIYDLAETHACRYAIRLKMSSTLKSLAADIEADLDRLTKDNKVDYAVCHGDFMYKASSWKYARRVVCKVEKSTDQMTYMYTFVVTNMDLDPEDIIRFYCNRGRMENFIKESKNGFDFSCMSSHAMVVNAGRLMICMLAYNLFNWFKRLVLPKQFQKMQIETFRLKLIKIAARVIRSSRYRSFRFCSSCPYKDEFREILLNIQQLQIPELAV